MAIKIYFDPTHNPEEPTFILAKRNGDKLGLIDAKSIQSSDYLNEPAEVTFNVYKYIDGKKNELWDKIVNFKLVYCVEWNQWFEITVELDESNETIKTVFGTQLGQAELSQINLYDVEINTEADIEREDYKDPTVLFNKDNTKASLLHRILEKAPHYSVKHVDDTIAKIQRTFSFSDTSIYDAMQEIAEEIHCLFVFNEGEDEEIHRTISVYDLESNCANPECKHRGEFSDVCPKCGGTDSLGNHYGIKYYGDDTTIFVTADELADDIQLTTDTGAVKNCFKLEAGDDLMTATVRSCNPNGSDYIWYLSDAMKEDMSGDLVDKLNSYDKLYKDYQTNEIELSDDAISMIKKYNALITDIYQDYNSELELVETPINGYSSLIDAYYNTIDFELYLRSGLMPSAEISKKNAATEAAKLTTSAFPTVATNSKLQGLSDTTADNVVLSMAKILVDSRFKVKVADNSTLSSYVDGQGYRTWTGKFIVTDYSNDEDVAESAIVSVKIDNNDESFTRQKLEKALSQEDTDDVSISGLFKRELDDFKNELKKYGLNSLSSFQNSCQTCIDILIEQGAADGESWAGESSKEDVTNVYDDLYVPYRKKLEAIDAEMKVREEEIAVISGIYDTDGDLITYGLKNYIEDIKAEIQKKLDFEAYLGEELWFEFCSFRREDKYSNSNYISDGFNNAEIINHAKEFIEVAQKEIYKSAELQHSISASLKNLLVIKKFAPLVDHFQVGNWIRVQADDEIYKLRLISYEIDYESLDGISVEFSDTTKVNNSITDVKDIISQASSMATSYSAVQRQASQGESSKSQLNDWVNNGLALTQMKIVNNADNQNITWDEHGILCREYIPETDEYDDRQLKIINRGLYVTDDGWQTSKAGIGNFNFYNPKTKQTEEAYGVIADTLVGNLILSEEVGIYNEDSSITLDQSGFTMTVDKTDDSTNNAAFVIRNKIGEDEYENVMYVDSYGDFYLNSGAININVSSDEGTSVDTLDGALGSVVQVETDLGQLTIRVNGHDGEFSTVNQNATSLTDRVGDAEGNLSTFIQEATKMEGVFTSYASNSNVEGKIQEAVNKRETIIRMDDNGIEIGKKENDKADPFRMLLTNRELGFYENNQKVAWISDEMLNIENAVVGDKLQFGNFVWDARDNGNMGLRWVGDE